MTDDHKCTGMLLVERGAAAGTAACPHGAFVDAEHGEERVREPCAASYLTTTAVFLSTQQKQSALRSSCRSMVSFPTHAYMLDKPLMFSKLRPVEYFHNGGLKRREGLWSEKTR